ncbi:sigma factor-like helix-turn-helix DNA-binding protein [Paenibacillus sp. GCM10027626]|uniref:sigma factor-like helix-turn-helix DNA-binding protein n=1 Tax=Paenibacillus sp. GCM10027626 TaxID=3273411 RepID=UPI00362BBAB1
MGDKKYRMPELDERGYLADIRELKQAYRKTYWQLRQALKECGEHGADAHLLRGMISDINFAIMWMHTGRRPGNKRGIERRAAYQREKLMDPLKMQSYMQQTKAASPSSLTDDEAHRLREVLDILSPQERECFTLSFGQCFPHSYIADMLGISKGAVDKYVQRAHAKVTAGWQGTLF